MKKVDFNGAYKKLFKEYSRMTDLGAYKNIGAEDIVQEGVISFLEKNKDLSIFENQQHLVATMANFIKNRRRSLTHNVNLRAYKLSKHERFTDELNDQFVDPNNMIDMIDLEETTFSKLYYRGHTLSEVGTMLNVSHMSVLRGIRKEMRGLV